MRGPSSSGSRRSSSGQAAQLLDFSQHPQRAPAPPPARPTRAAPHRGQQRRTPRGEPGGCHLNLLLQKWKQSQNRQQEGIIFRQKSANKTWGRGNEDPPPQFRGTRDVAVAQASLVSFFQFLSLTVPVTLFSDRLNWGEGGSLQELGRVLN